MDEQLLLEAKNQLGKNYSFQEVKNYLIKKGILESDADEILSSAISQLRMVKEDSDKRLLRQLGWKELLDKVGYGFVSHPFINILFSLSGASYLIIGLLNGLRTVFSLFFSSFLKEFSKVQELNKQFISRAGLLYGFSFLFMSFAVVLKSPFLYALAFLLGGIGVVFHGELYTDFLSRNVKKERTGRFLLILSKYGIIITVVSLLLSGYIMDLFPVFGKAVSVHLFGGTFSVKIYGYLVSFEVTAFAFIISATIFAYVRQKSFDLVYRLSSFFPDFLVMVKSHSGFFLKNRVVLLLLLTSLITGLVQILGNSFYGIFIYDTFKDGFFGGFLNVAVVFSVAAVFSLIGPWLTKALHRHIGISPMLVFGTLLTAMLPLSLAFNPDFRVVVVATALSIIGSSILVMAQSFFTRKLLSQEQRNIYFSFLGVFLIIPMLVFVPLGSYIAAIDLVLLFKIIIGVLVIVATPLYFLIVVLYEKNLEILF